MSERPEPVTMLLQARKPEGGNWIDIFPAQLQRMAKDGCDVRALEMVECNNCGATVAFGDCCNECDEPTDH